MGAFFSFSWKKDCDCECCHIILTVLNSVIASVMLSTHLSVGYFGLGCYDPSHNNNNNNNKGIVLDTESFTCFGTFSFEKR